jgi:RimJ/RimL family protein N-acetyltransferase
MKNTRKKVHANRIIFRMGKRIYLRPILKEDVPLLTIWINDPEVHQFLKVNAPMSPEDEIRFVDSLREKKETDIVFAIILEKTNEFIGVMALHKIDHRNGTATTGSFIGRKDLWSKGYGTEAKMLVLEFAFNMQNLRKICSSTYDFNGRSKRCLEKCGYHEEGVKKKQKYRNGRYCDEHVMAVFKEDFLLLWKKYKKKFLS